MSVCRAMMLLTSTPVGRRVLTLVLLAGLAAVAPGPSHRSASRAAEQPRTEAAGEIDLEKHIVPILEDYCYRCHAGGSKRGGLALDQLAGSPDPVAGHEKWLAVWRSLRARIMPPPNKDQPSEPERALVMKWIERDVFRLDPAHPDPGRVTVRRLNRQEYRNTIFDLLGVEFDTTEAFPADDTGYGFDTIGDVLSISPLLLEKYLEAARAIVSQAVVDGPSIPSRTISADQFRGDGQKKMARLPFAVATTVQHVTSVEHSGAYRLRVAMRVTGSAEATTHTADLVLHVNGQAMGRRHLGWDFNKDLKLAVETNLRQGPNTLALELIPKDPPQEGERPLFLSLRDVELYGPLDGSYKEYPPAYRRVFFDGPPPTDSRQREAYARKILRHLADRAFRRPVDEPTLDRLVALALKTVPAKATFEQGVARALTALLTSPRFLFRAEIQPEPNNPGRVVPLDEFALASRLSYFLWSSLPDEELFQLARAGKLRANLRGQVDRMIADPRADRFVGDFIGQWLQTRDVETINVNAPRILGLKTQEEAGRVFNRLLRRAMRAETELLFTHLLRDNGSALDLLTADYTFLNEPLAKFYGIEGVVGTQMRKVSLPPDSHRGGILTQASFLIVTSNPARTSPVKRGLFILDNLLGTPAPPPPANVPALEEAAGGRRDLSLRQVLEIHRAQPLCASCHARMDPLGLALEEYNALGMWRARDHGQPIATAGQLITGEKFSNVRELARVIAVDRRRDFYSCLTEKMLTYAIGRGVEFYDAPTVEKIVGGLDQDGGRLRALIYGIAESAPFQLRRGDGERLPAPKK